MGKVPRLVSLCALAAIAGAFAGYALRGASTASGAAARGATELAAGRTDTAITSLGEALRESPTDDTARLALARAYVARGWHEQARQQFELSAENARRTLRGAYLGLSELEEKSGNRTDARNFADAAKAVK